MSAAYVLLEDGTRFDGEACGAPGHAVGEVVFTTGMSGYQESHDRPVVPRPADHVHGADDRQLRRQRARRWSPTGSTRARRSCARRSTPRTPRAPSAAGSTGCCDCGVPGITGVDTRALVRHIREAGAMLGGVFPARWARSEARALIAAEPPMAGRDLARAVTIAEPHVDRRATAPARGWSRSTPASRARSCATSSSAGATLELLPCTTPADELLARGADGAVPRARPGRPGDARLRRRHDPRRRSGRCPCSASASATSCSRQAVGLETFKLPFGHRGGNHPVKDLRTGRIAITAQNHGFAVRGEAGQRLQTDFGEAELTHVNLYDGTIEGIRLLDVAAGCVQYHPEAGPGPHDTRRPVRRVPARSSRPCRVGTTSTRSSCSAPARS